MPLRLLLDTSAYSHFRAGHDEVLALLSEAEEVVVPAVVLGELEAGFRLGRRLKENVVALNEFLSEPFVRVARVDEDVARHYGHVFAGLRQAGTPIPTNDIWIAAAALATASHLISFDEDFGRIPGLDWSLLRSRL